LFSRSWEKLDVHEFWDTRFLVLICHFLFGVNSGTLARNPARQRHSIIFKAWNELNLLRRDFIRQKAMLRTLRQISTDEFVKPLAS
jgi:hypothetical protein